MGIREPSGRSEKTPLEPLCAALLQLTKIYFKELKLEGETAMGDAEPLVDGSHAASDQDDARQISTAPSTKSEELPEMETGKEVAVRSVNPTLQVQDGEERVTSTANSLEGNGDVGMEPEGESHLNPLVIEESESDSEESERPTWIPPSYAPEGSLPERRTWNPPMYAPEGSLVHTLYLLLLGAGTDGITVRELFKCLKKPAQVLGFESDWKVQVRRHLKTNPFFREVKGYHYLVGNHQSEVQQPKSSPANIASTSRRDGASSSKTDPSSHHSTPETVQTGLSVDTQKGVVQSRRKAFQKAIAALSEQATEFEEMHQSMDDMQMPSSVADPRDSQLVSLTSCRKRKSPSAHDEELTHHGLPIPGDLHATEAETFANMEVQTGQRCVVEKDDTGKWRCRMTAMAGHTVCEYHRCLQSRQEDVKASLSPDPGSPKYLTASKPSIAQDAGVQTRVRDRCGHRHKYKDGTWSKQCCRIVMKDHWLCENHKQLREERKARQHADAQQGNKQRASYLQHNQDSSIRMGLPESHTNLDQSSLPLHPKPATVSPRISREDTPSHTEAAKDVDKPATGVSNHEDDSNRERLPQQMPKNVARRHHVAARKTAANVGPLKSQALIRTPATPPLPPPHGIRRKTPVKNTDH